MNYAAMHGGVTEPAESARAVLGEAAEHADALARCLGAAHALASAVRSPGRRRQGAVARRPLTVIFPGKFIGTYPEDGEVCEHHLSRAECESLGWV